MLLIVDYKMGNLGSIQNMLKKIGVDSIVSDNKAELERAKKIILPGVGRFDRAMANLKNLDLINLLNYKVINEKTPVLGICLGMQLLAESSEEGEELGFGWIKGNVKKFNFVENTENLKIPHMGWNFVRQQKESLLLNKLHLNSRFYFVHSYHFVTSNQEDILCTTEYGYEFVSAVSSENIMGVQFHPEKSHKFGMQLLKNFVEEI